MSDDGSKPSGGRGGRGGRGTRGGRGPRREPGSDNPWPSHPPGQRPPEDRPRKEYEPREEREDRPRGERPSERPPRRPDSRPPSKRRPPQDRPRGDRPRDDRPRGDRPRGDRPWRDRPQSDRPRDDRPPRRNPPPRRPPEPDPEEVAREEARRRLAARIDALEKVEITIEKIVYGGEGLGRFEGIPIFVPRSAPGDRLRVRLTEKKASYGRGEIDEILEPGPGRREAPCPFFARCGGCDLQHLDESTQLRAKSEAVIETLRRLGGVDSLPERFEIVPGDPWGYRTRTQLHVEPTKRGVEAGYFERGSHDLVPVDRCPILVPTLEDELRTLPRKLRDEQIERIDLAAGDGGAWTASPPREKLPQGEIVSTVGDFAYTWDARVFFQGHRQLAPTLVDLALGDPAKADGDAVAYDLYAGVGLFALPLARHYAEVVAVEGDRIASRFARKNAKNAGARNVRVETHMLDSWIDNLPENPERVLVDPPRVGLSDRVRRAILSRKPRWITYVSCNPSTLARDLRELLRFYRMESLALLDLFPQTGHMEAVVQLWRIDEDDRA